MQNPFVALGLDDEASADQIRAAYHARVKLCHPDALQDKKAQQAAQDVLVQLNLTYAEAMRLASLRNSQQAFIPDAMQVAKQLYGKGHYESALRILGKAQTREAEWYQMQGEILLKLGEAEAAHASFRAAVRLSPDNTTYHEYALRAGVLLRKQRTLLGKIGCWAKSITGKAL